GAVGLDVGIVDLGQGGHAVHRAAQDDHDELAALAFWRGRVGGAGRDQGDGAAGKEEMTAVEGEGHVDYLRWHSGDMRARVKPCSALSARATAWRVLAPAMGPSARSRNSLGVMARDMRRETELAHSRRFLMASAPDHEAVSSGQPAGDGAEKGC